MESKDKRTYIIKKCYKLLLQKGFDGVSISDIQKECSVARGLLYHYFGSKEELFYEVVNKEVLTRLYIKKSEISNYNFRQYLNKLCNKYYKICITDGLEGISLINFDFLMYRAIKESPEVKLQYEVIKKREIDALIQSINQSMKNGYLREDIDPEEIAIYTNSLIDGVWVGALSEGNAEQLAAQLEKMLALNLQLLNHK